MKKQTRLVKQRRLQNKTNYRRRLSLIKGGKPRFVVRKSNRYLVLQIIESKNAQDRTIYHANTKELLKKGWPEKMKGSLKSIPAAYFGGFLLGKKAKDLKSEIILDLGLIPNTKGSRVYAAVKGLLDSGINIKVDKSVFPNEEKINGKNSKLNEEILTKVKSAIK